MSILNAKVERNKTQKKLNIAKSWKTYQKVKLRNVKIKEISNFGPLKITETILCYQKPLMLLMKWTDTGIIAFSKLFVLDYGSLAWIQSNLSGSFCEVLLKPNSPLSSQISHSSLSIISKVLLNICFVFSQKLQSFQNSFTWIALLVNGNQFCHTELF